MENRVRRERERDEMRWNGMRRGVRVYKSKEKRRERESGRRRQKRDPCKRKPTSGE